MSKKRLEIRTDEEFNEDLAHITTAKKWTKSKAVKKSVRYFRESLKTRDKPP